MPSPSQWARATKLPWLDCLLSPICERICWDYSSLAPAVAKGCLQVDRRLCHTERTFGTCQVTWWLEQQHKFDCRHMSGGRFQVGDQVWVYPPAVPKGKSPKLYQPWTGPFVIIKVLSNVTYRIHVQAECPAVGQHRHHQRLVAHFNHLKPF